MVPATEHCPPGRVFSATAGPDEKLSSQRSFSPARQLYIRSDCSPCLFSPDDRQPPFVYARIIDLYNRDSHILPRVAITQVAGKEMAGELKPGNKEKRGNRIFFFHFEIAARNAVIRADACLPRGQGYFVRRNLARGYRGTSDDMRGRFQGGGCRLQDLSCMQFGRK